MGQQATAGAKTRISSILIQSEKTVAALLQSVSQAIIGVDREGRMVLVNSMTEEMFGYSNDELLGAPMERLLPEAMADCHSRERAEFFTRPRPRPMGMGMDLLARRKDGSEFPVEICLSCVETSDGVFAMAFITDISQRKKLEEQLLHSQKMEAVGRLAAGVAHDFNNLLTVIAGYGRMIFDELPGSDPLRCYADEVLKAADRAAALTNRLLAFSRPQVFRPQVANVNSLLSSTEKMLRRLIGEDINLLLSLDPDVANIRADSAQLEQIIVNLAVNSRDAMPKGGQIIIKTGNVRLDHSYSQLHMGVKPGDYAMISVSDTGHGMDSETKRRIFEPFFTTKEKGKGTGLGLASVYGIVNQSGGNLWVDSEPGKGTTFKLYFPAVQDAPAESAEAGKITPESAVAGTVLVVEDDNGVRDLTVGMLRRLGYKVLSAGTASAAIEISRKYPAGIDLLMTDIVMPEMSGRQLADVLLRERSGLRILFVSGYTGETTVTHGVPEFGVNFLPKPFGREALAEQVSATLNNQKPKDDRFVSSVRAPQPARTVPPGRPDQQSNSN